jgi:flagellar motor switch protein FliN/FliY
MDGMLSQEEINALLGSMSDDDNSQSADETETVTDVPEAAEPVAASASSDDKLSPEEADALGEVANISMGTAATTLSVLVNNRVDITTPTVSYTTLEDIANDSSTPCVFIYISYKAGLEGKNILVLKERDVKVITDLMMGGDGTNTEGELTDLHLSAICEAMNQMMGSASTSMSSMINDVVDISPPTATRVDFAGEVSDELEELAGQTFALVSFRMVIGDLVDSQIMQLYPLEFARTIYQRFLGSPAMEDKVAEDMAQSQSTAQPAPQPAPQPQPQPAPQPAPTVQQPVMNNGMAMAPAQQPMYAAMPAPDVNIQPAQFQSFSQVPDLSGIAPENIDLIMDVPLEVTVELGRTSKSIKEILDFSPGTIIELDKLAGEPVDVLVNGKFVAKGEVVVIEESFGIRVTEIIKE